MGRLFNRKPEPPRRLLSVHPEELSSLGRAAFGGDSPYPQGLGPVLTYSDQWLLEALERSGHPAAGTQAWSEFEETCLVELFELARTHDEWTKVGALCVVANLNTNVQQRSPLCNVLILEALEFLRRDGLAYGVLPSFALDAWADAFGHDGIAPAGWPSALETLPRPDVATLPKPQPLGHNERRLLAVRNLGGLERRYSVESRGERFYCVIEGIDPDDGVMKAWDWPGADSAQLTGLLDVVADKLITPTDWAHPDLAPYFPCSPRSRARMRELALLESPGVRSGEL